MISSRRRQEAGEEKWKIFAEKLFSSPREGLYSLVLSCLCYPALSMLGGSWAAACSSLWGLRSAVEDPEDAIRNPWPCRVLSTTLHVQRALSLLLLVHSIYILLWFFSQMGKLRLAEPDWQLASEAEENHGQIPWVTSWCMPHWIKKTYIIYHLISSVLFIGPRAFCTDQQQTARKWSCFVVFSTAFLAIKCAAAIWGKKHMAPQIILTAVL